MAFTDLEEALADLGYGGGASRRELAEAGLSIRKKKSRGDRQREILMAKLTRRARSYSLLKKELEDVGVLGPVNIVCWNRGLLHADGNADYVALLGWNGRPAKKTPEAHEARVDLAHYLRYCVGWTYRRTEKFFARLAGEVMRGLRGRMN